MNITCGMCSYSGDIETFPPNLTSMHNACRCPKCGSTKNNYNSVWSRHIGEVMKGERIGPVTHEAVMEELENKEISEACQRAEDADQTEEWN